MGRPLRAPNLLVVKCPVSKDILGYRREGQPFSALCPECKWIYSWDKGGNSLKPVQYVNRKEKECGCPLHRSDEE